MSSLSRREFLRWSLMGSAAVVMAACAPQETTGQPVVSEVDGAPAAPAAQKITIRYQARSDSDTAQLWDAFFEYFRDNNPNVEVLFTPRPGGDLEEHLMSQAVAGDAPDVYQLCCWQSTYMIQQLQALNLQPFIDRDAAEVDIDDFYDQQFGAWLLNGDIHFMPYYTGTVALYYNKDMFDDAGVPYPSTEWGEVLFDDVRVMASQFVRREDPILWGLGNYGHGGGWTNQYWLRGFGANMVDPDDHNRSLLCSDEAIACLEAIRQMIHDEKSFSQGAEMGGMGVIPLFNAGRIAMMEMGSWGLRPSIEAMCNEDGTEFVEDRFDIAAMWKGPGPKGKITTHQSVDGQGCWSRTKHPEESWQLVKELASPTFYTLSIKVGSGLQPSRKSIMPIWEEELRQKWPVLRDVNLEVFSQGMYQSHGGPEEMFNNDKVAKSTILQPAYDQVMLMDEAPVQLICEHSKVIEKFNTGVIKLEEIGRELANIRL